MQQKAQITKYQVPLDTIEINFKRIGILGLTIILLKLFLGKGFDFLLETSNIVYLLQDQNEQCLIVCQEYNSLTQQQINQKLTKVCQMNEQFYIGTYMKFICWTEEVRLQEQEKTLYLFYDYNYIEYDLHTFIELRVKQGQPFTEEEIWELVSYLIISFAISGNETLEYTDIEPFSIYLSKSAHVKYIIGNLNLRIPNIKWQENQLPTYYSDDLPQGKRSKVSAERNFVFKIGMLVLYLLRGKPFQEFNRSLIENLEENIPKLIAELNPSEQLVEFLNCCIQRDESLRLTCLQLFEQFPKVLLGDQCIFHQGPIKNEQINFTNYVGIVFQQGKQLCPNGLGRGDQLCGYFKMNEMYGYGIHNNQNTIAYGEWQKNKVTNGFIHTKEWFFFGEFSDPNLSKAKGFRVNVFSVVEKMNETNMVLFEEGSFINGKLTQK